MDIKTILKKVVAGTELTEEEKSYLAKFDPSVEAKQERQRAEELNTQLESLQTRIEELENQGKTAEEQAKATAEKELKKLRDQVKTLTEERDTAQSNLAKTERTAKINTLAGKHNFSDAAYLDYLTSNTELDLDDETATANFMKELSSNHPELFKSTVKPGGGTGGTQKNTSDTASLQTRLDEIMKKPELTSREACEVIDLQTKIQSSASDENAK